MNLKINYGYIMFNILEMTNNIWLYYILIDKLS